MKKKFNDHYYHRMTINNKKQNKKSQMRHKVIEKKICQSMKIMVDYSNGKFF